AATLPSPPRRTPRFCAEVPPTPPHARPRRRNNTLPSTSPPPERDAFLVLVRSRASLAGLRGGRFEGQEDVLSEPLSDRQLKGLGRRVEGAEGEGPGETRVDDPERCDDPTAGPGRPQPDLAGDVPPQLDRLSSADGESGPRGDAVRIRLPLRRGHDHFVDGNVVSVRSEIPGIERLDSYLAFRDVRQDVGAGKQAKGAW